MGQSRNEGFSDSCHSKLFLSVAPGQLTKSQQRSHLSQPLSGMLTSNLQALSWSLTILLTKTLGLRPTANLYTAIVPLVEAVAIHLSPLPVCFSGSHTQLWLWVIVCLFFHCITSGKGFASVWWLSFHLHLGWIPLENCEEVSLLSTEPVPALFSHLHSLSSKPFPSCLFCSA